MMVVALAFGVGCGRRAAREVVVYVAHDQIYSDGVLKSFEAETGIRTKVAYDTEASKTTGLVQRLIAESANPRADVFWNNEQAQTLVLKSKGCLAPYVSPNAGGVPAAFKCRDGLWTGFAARARVIIYNTRLAPAPPASIFELTDPKWQGKAAIALPLFGTTATHAAALFERLGADDARRFFLDLKQNGVIVAGGNSHVRDLVAQGEAWVGLTDTDDANGGVLDGKPVRWLFPDQGKDGIGTLVIPNTVAMIKGGPDPEAARQLIDYLLSPETEIRLARSRALQIPLRTDVAAPENVPTLSAVKAMNVDFEKVASRMPEAAAFIRDTFVE